MEFPGASGLIMNEPLLWEKGRAGRCGFSLPRRDVPFSPVDEALTGTGPDFPDLSEGDIVRHYTRLSQWNFCVDSGLYPLGSCTMKYSPKISEKQVGRRGFASAHPMIPALLSQGILRIMHELERTLCEITGMDAASLQPAAGAQGELAGMLIIHAFHRSNGEKRTKILVPDTAHGTNPASAALCGYTPVPIPSGVNGILSPDAVASLMDEDTAGIMITNPNTLGLFENNIAAIAGIIHAKGGLVYGDGANMNALMGIVKPGEVGVDVMHLNLHKTFAAPHGGGGPGSGPVCVKKHLAEFLPVPRIVMEGGKYLLSENFPGTIGKVHAFHGNVGVMIKAYCYIRLMGAEGLKRASEIAVLNANYVKEMLKNVYHLPYEQICMHECVLSDKNQNEYKISTLDIVKRLMDYGYHPPTVYFPLVVPGAIMIEPTETESKEELDLFITAMKSIAREAKEAPYILREAPHRTKVKRLDETRAARQPCLAG